jgi:hypothetical protein
MEGIVNVDISKPMILIACLVLSLTSLGGCTATDDARVLQLLNERGFGRKYTGNANEVFYFGIGDTIKFVDKDNPELQGQAKIRMDGTVDFPQLGETYVAGLTTKEIANMLNLRLGHYYKNINISVSPGIVLSKRIFIQLDTDKHIIKKFEGDQTIFDVMQSIKYDSILVDLDNIRVIRADPVHPLVIYCDIDDMMTDGYSRDNILVKEDDIIYCTPTLIGYFVRFVKVLIAPLQPVAQLFTAARQIDYMYESFGEDYYYGYNRGRRY